MPGFVHTYVGAEAVAVGVCAHLADADLITSTHRGHGHCLAKGVPIAPIIAELYGRETGLCKGRGGSMHVADFSRGMLGANAIVGGGSRSRSAEPSPPRRSMTAVSLSPSSGTVLPTRASSTSR